jgi:ribokinase
MTRVAVVGHVEWVEFVSVDRLPAAGDVIHAHGMFSRAAGGGGVAAAILAELGADVDFFCALGRDGYGRAAVQEMAERGIHTHVAWRERPTRRALTMLDDGGERTIVTIGDRLAPLGSDDLDWELLEHSDGAYFTAGDGGALERARTAKMLVASPRGGGALDHGDVTIDALVFSANDADEEAMAVRAADRARVQVATDGAQGGRWWGESSGKWEAVKPPGKPRDSYGCGDSFAAAFTLGLGRGNSMSDAVALGAVTGALVLTRAGAP